MRDQLSVQKTRIRRFGDRSVREQGRLLQYTIEEIHTVFPGECENKKGVCPSVCTVYVYV